jgi:hypothetical protein
MHCWHWQPALPMQKPWMASEVRSLLAQEMNAAHRAPEDRRPETAIQNSASALPEPSARDSKPGASDSEYRIGDSEPGFADSDIGPRVPRAHLADSNFSATDSKLQFRDSGQRISRRSDHDLQEGVNQRPKNQGGPSFWKAYDDKKAQTETGTDTCAD